MINLPGLLGGIAGFGTFILYGLLLERAIKAFKRRRSLVVLSYVEQGMRLNAPLPEFLYAASLGEKGPVRRTLTDLRDLLGDGVDVPSAIQTVAPSLPHRTIDLIAAGWRSGMAPAALRRIIEERRSQLRGDPITAIYLRWYPPMLLLALTGVVLIISIFIMPKYIDILKDFGVPLPRATRAAMEINRTLVVAFGLIADAWVVSVILLRIARTIRNKPEQSGSLWLWDAIACRLPLWGAAVRARHWADVAGVMADALAAGRPMHEALSEARQVRGNKVLGARVARWADGVDRGLTLSDAAREAGLPRLFYGTLAMGQLSGGEEEGLRFLQRHYGSVFSRAAILLRAAMLPAIVLCAGAAVTLAALALFEPIIAMINILTPHSGGL